MSLKLRLVFSALIILVLFITIAGFALDKAYYISSKTALTDQLTMQLYYLMSATEIDDEGNVNMPATLLETKFSLPSSGLYAYIVNKNNQIIWKSLSTIGIQTPTPEFLAKGKQHFFQQQLTHHEFYTIAQGVNWLIGNKNEPVTFNVQTDLTTFYKQINSYRTTLWTWLGGMAVLLLTVLSLLIYWGLAPLRKVVQEVNAVETGQQNTIQGQYPPEIQTLSNSINQYIDHEQLRRNRYKNALGDLAHSLKTPLAVIRNTLSGIKANETLPADKTLGDKLNTLNEQVERIDNTVQYQLQRATTLGNRGQYPVMVIKPELQRIIRTLQKIHHNKNITVELQLNETLAITFSKNDFMEIMGNLLENAFKWCHEKISIRVEQKNHRTTLTIADDGQGITPEERKNILQRGYRADSQTPGHGIGLAMVQDILAMYETEIHISQSDLGGAKIYFSIDS